MTKEELKARIEDDNYGLYDVDGKWLFEMREKNSLGHLVSGLNSVMYLMNPAKPVAGTRKHSTVGIKVPTNSTDEFILDKVSIAKRDYSKYAHEVDLDGGDLGLPSL